MSHRIRKAQSDGARVIDVDGTYLEKKRSKLLAAGVNMIPLSSIPTFPVTSWCKVSPENASLPPDFPSISQGTLYTYLAEGVGNTHGKKAFRALKRGYVHFTSGRVTAIEIQNKSQSYAFVRSSMTP